MSKGYTGGCYCGAVRWEVTGKPLVSAYCHCSLCQRLSGAPFINTIHFPAPAFKWVHGSDSVLDSYAVEAKPWKKRWRCKTCGACVASFHEKGNRWSMWGSQLDRDEEGKVKADMWEDLKPTVHIFYETRLLDVKDGLPKWSGYAGSSERLK
ncbi:hypothetical protein P691DRAFT_692565 [Macrolepiota fuliginosa MF-IS2]|uniref:CENP-V/GFA domain-containing protein n=1 Tax=Macrolepiota fuliginosa MF-IS2 TaxID=1400762 RepID=A0A9P5XPY2_9AGAR|nr:hypothetical protein P691DRAFT_692565 [Macrolepiota fuliginosa MF-IS2]